LLVIGGCTENPLEKGLFDQTEMMRVSKERLLVPVLPSLAGVLDEADAEFVNADNVKQADLIPSKTDYVIGANDLLSISITEVAGPGVESVKTTRVSESGRVSLPLVGSVQSSGMTEAELEKAIAQKYRDANIIQNAQVSVTVIEARQRTFSILGAVGRPGQYQIVQSDFRLLDAITLAGDIPIQGIENLYIIRKNPKASETTKPSDTGTTPNDTGKPNKPVDPLEQRKQGRGLNIDKTEFAQGAVVNHPVHLMLLDAPADAGTDPSEGGRKIMVDGKWVPVKGATAPGTPAPATAAPTTPGTTTPGTTAPGTTAPAPLTPAPSTPAVAPETTPAPGSKVEPLTPVTPPDTTTAAPATGPSSFEFDEPKRDPDIRVIRVPLDRLQRGELEYNVVVRPNDTIIVPSPKVGEYYMGGHVGRPGVYSLTGRNITLKQAIISAGMIDPLGWPERTEVIRRIGKDREMFVRVNLPKIFAGEQSDFYLRPYDTVNVGTNALAPFLAAIRNAFRFTYGFGFIYDQNFSPDSQANRNR
jgi:protein involved in polysaccharide export with SLBB domain